MDNLTKSQRCKNMRNIRSAGTMPEKLIMRALQRRKVYFAKNDRSIVGKPDIVFRRRKTAVFIDSDFWHGHPKRFIMPKSNRQYWKEKIRRNKERYAGVNKRLKEAGWKVIRIWEFDIKKNTDKYAGKILEELDKN
jgi:DNA mismatch endonuclease, patch repair protein